MEMHSKAIYNVVKKQYKGGRWTISPICQVGMLCGTGCLSYPLVYWLPLWRRLVSHSLYYQPTNRRGEASRDGL